MTNTQELVAQLTVEEKVALLSGSDVWRTHAVPRLGIPAVKVSDGPNGVRGDSTTGARAVCLPASICLAASFDVGLVTELGDLLGRETTRKGAHILLAPTLNMARHPLGGRNFESFGEEPNLTAPMAAAYIRGVQDNGVGACAKHLVANDVEEARLTVNSEVDEQTLREVYLRPFEVAAEVDVWSMMSAYPKLNGQHCTEHHWLMTTVLRDEWGFDGLVMSDWGATHHPTRSVAAGMSLEMPGPAKALGEHLLAAVQAGELDEEILTARAAEVVDLTVRAGLLNTTEEPERSIDRPEERELVRRAAAAGTVLLTNRAPSGSDTDRPVLPLADARSVAIIGPNADPGVIQGGGSAQLKPHAWASPVAGITDALPNATVTHHLGCVGDRYVPAADEAGWTVDGGGDDVEGPILMEVFEGPNFDGDPVVASRARRIGAFHQGSHPALGNARSWSQRWTGTLAVTETGVHRFGVLAVGRSRVLVNGSVVADNWTDPQPGQAFFEYASAEVVGAIDLAAGTEATVVVEWSVERLDQLAGLRFGHQPPLDQDGLMDAAVEAAAAADVAVVVAGLNADWETESHDRAMYGLPGRQDELIRKVVAANPSTVVVINAGGPVDLPWLNEVPATLVVWYPGQAFGEALADVLTGRRDPGGRLPVTFPVSLDDAPTAGLVPGDGKTLPYGEGVFVGHRWYHEHGIDPRAAFGHGLSYATHELGAPTLDTSGPSPTVAVPVTNTADRPGKCVVQLYLNPSTANRPRVFAGFAARIINPGETATLTCTVDEHAMRFWDDGAGGWAPLTGTHQLEVATSSVAVAHTLDLAI
ncbi:MAG: glycoside hydrolase family 3 C-terminal domain-containing protein [Actinomycetota bacterium]